MDLFEHKAKEYYSRYAPLADRMRPQTLSEFAGQKHLFCPGGAIQTLLEQQTLRNLIFWGPPGTGKTTLARLLAGHFQAHFEQISAVHSGKKDLTRIEQEARERLQYHDKTTILFIDEIHRYNKAQQDGLLAPIEKGVYTLIGATTENPSFELNSALLSRCQTTLLEPLEPEALEEIVSGALSDAKRGLGNTTMTIETKAMQQLVLMSDGDARKALNHLELGALAAASRTGEGKRQILNEDLEQGLSRRMILYDKSGDEHYNTISAFIKSIRGSDPQAGVYYLARMLSGGEDPVFIARRLSILASEDIGLADPQAAILAASILQTVKAIGMPEARIPLAQITVYLSLAPKSNAAYVAIDAALKEVKETGQLPIPKKILNAPTSLMKSEGYGKNYHYAHQYTDGFFPEKFLPESILDHRFYNPTEQGQERILKERLASLEKQIEENK